MAAAFHVVLTDHEFPDVEIERSVLAAGGATLTAARCLTPEELIRAAADADAILTQFVPMSRSTFEQLPRLRAVTRYGVGYDQIDVAGATDVGVVVCNVPDYGIEEVATHALSLILYFVRGLDVVSRGVRNRLWGMDALDRPIRPLTEMTLGVVGLGPIGSEVARYCSALGMNVIGCDPYAEQKEIPLVGFEELLSRSDVVTIHCPLNKATEDMFDETAFAGMKSEAFLVNCARGGIVKTSALNRALRDGQIAGAGLDVLVGDPPDWDDPILSAPNTLITGHMAWHSTRSIQRLREFAAQSLVDLFQGRRPTGLLNPTALSSERWAGRS